MIRDGEIEFRTCAGELDAAQQAGGGAKFFWTDGTAVCMSSKQVVIGLLAVGILSRRSIVGAQKAIEDLRTGDGEFIGGCEDMAFTLDRVSNILEGCRSECSLFDEMLVAGAFEAVKKGNF